MDCCRNILYFITLKQNKMNKFKAKKKFNKQALKAKRLKDLEAENNLLVSERTVWRQHRDRIIDQLQNLG